MFANLGITRAASVEAYVIGPELRAEGEYLWIWFCEISLGLSSGGFAVPTVTWEGVLAWKILTGTPIERWEALLMVRLGQLRSSILSEPDKKT